MKRALVLSGGTAKGAFQVGMLKGLLEQDSQLDFDIIRGVSVGALNGAFLAQYKSGADSFRVAVEKLERIWRGIRSNDDVYRKIPGLISPAPNEESINELSPLKALIDKHLDVNCLASSGRDFKIGTVSLVSGKYDEWSPPPSSSETSKPTGAHSDNDFVQKLIASTAIPVIFPIVDDGGNKDVLVDGGVRNITPLDSVFCSDPCEIYVLLTGRVSRDGRNLPVSEVQKRKYERWRPNRTNWRDVLERTIDILVNEVFVNDIKTALRWNDVARSLAKLTDPQVRSCIEKATGYKRDVKINVLAPTKDYGSEDNGLDFDPDLISDAILHGKEIAIDRKRWAVSA